MRKGRKTLLVVAGPTAVGKTSLCIRLAQHVRAEIISGDSRQFFKEMGIGTAKPSESELKAVPHHFINTLSITQDYDVRRYELEALQKIDEIFKTHSLAILTGGSGMYIKAVTEGFDDMPAADPQIRDFLNNCLKDKGIETLQEKLKDADPEYYHEIDIKNPQRLIRALEVYMISGKPVSSYRRGASKARNFKIIKIGLDRDRDELYERIDKRMEDMINEGLFEEAQGLFPYRHHNALQTVGYKEIFDFIEGKYDKEEAIRLLKRNSRRYAKRQLTWFRKDPGYVWFHPGQYDKIVQYVESEV